MDALSMLCVVVGRCVDACGLLLDLLVSSLILLLCLLSNVAGSLHDMLVALTSSTLVEYWNPLFEGFKMVGHLFCHVAWRIKDVLHRGLLSGSCILRQTCEGICILLSLILYLVNTVVNIVLIGTQNCLSVLADVLDVVADPVHRVVDLALTLLTFLYSCLVGASVLLWTSCQLLLDSLGTFGRVFIAVFAVDCHSLLITAAIVLVALLFRNPRFRVLTGRLSHHLVRRLYAATLDAALALQVVHARTEQDMSRTTFPQTDVETELVPQNEPSMPDTQGVEPVSCSRRTTVGSQPDCAVADGELLRLLKEQEERKKCIICQDSVKTVLLLPCRHLCLCRHCADILTQRRPVRCCPLCRQHITQTMDIFL